MYMGYFIVRVPFSEGVDLALKNWVYMLSGMLGCIFYETVFVKRYLTFSNLPISKV